MLGRVEEEVRELRIEKFIEKQKKVEAQKQLSPEVDKAKAIKLRYLNYNLDKTETSLPFDKMKQSEIEARKKWTIETKK